MQKAFPASLKYKIIAVFLQRFGKVLKHQQWKQSFWE